MYNLIENKELDENNSKSLEIIEKLKEGYLSMEQK